MWRDSSELIGGAGPRDTQRPLPYQPPLSPLRALMKSPSARERPPVVNLQKTRQGGEAYMVTGGGVGVCACVCVRVCVCVCVCVRV